MKLYPVILTDSVEQLNRQLALITSCPKITVVQIDLIDGSFVDNLTVGLVDLFGIDFVKLQLDLHLMVDEPLDWLADLAVWQHTPQSPTETDHGFPPIRSVIAQVEHMTDQLSFVQAAKEAGWLAGLSLNLYTDCDALDQEVLPELDIVQIMGVEAGFQGQTFNPLVLAKIQQLANLKRHGNLAKNCELLVDGGVNLANARKIKAAGATGLVVGSKLWQAAQIDKMVEQFYQI